MEVERVEETLRPTIRLLSAPQLERIVGQAIDVLRDVGVRVEGAEALALLDGAGARIDGDRAFIGEDAIRGALASAPSRVTLAGRDPTSTLELAGDRVHFDPGSAAVRLLDGETRRWRAPTTTDCAHFAWVTERCDNFQAQSTGLVPADVPGALADRVRLFVALRHSTRPVITGTFDKGAFGVMRDMLLAVRGSEQALRDAPLAVFDCCPTPPLSWSDLTASALVACARAGIPATLVSMPLGGATAPVTLRESVLQHCAESLSGVVLHQAACPGAPLLWGGAPSTFDMRHGTIPAGAMESAMLNVGCSQVGKHLELPTHGYLGLSDAKVCDWQAGAESAQGATLAALAGVNMVSGPGMLGFIGCQSLEKVLLDNEACGAALRLTRGVGHGSADEAPALMAALVARGTLLGHRHTRKSYRSELTLPGFGFDRAPYDEWEQAGARDAFQSAHEEVARIIAAGNPAPLPPATDEALCEMMRAEARRLGCPPLTLV